MVNNISFNGGLPIYGSPPNVGKAVKYMKELLGNPETRTVQDWSYTKGTNSHPSKEGRILLWGDDLNLTKREAVQKFETGTSQGAIPATKLIKDASKLKDTLGRYILA